MKGLGEMNEGRITIKLEKMDGIGVGASVNGD